MLLTSCAGDPATAGPAECSRGPNATHAVRITVDPHGTGPLCCDSWPCGPVMTGPEKWRRGPD